MGGGSPNKKSTFHISVVCPQGILDEILNVQPKEGGGVSKGETREAVVAKIADDMLRKLPRHFYTKKKKSNVHFMYPH